MMELYSVVLGGTDWTNICHTVEKEKKKIRQSDIILQKIPIELASG